MSKSNSQNQHTRGRPKVSVIMPVYNMADCLEAGVASVREQVIESLEIICVDDGSTDSSGEILARMAAEDSRIKVITQSNQGAGVARNAALRVAQGEFVAFIDPDDCYPDSSTLQTLYWGAVFNEALICGGSFSEKFNGEITTEFSDAFAKYTFREEKFINFSDYQFDYGYTRFIYNLDFLKENKIEFPSYLRYQDPPFMAQALATAGKFLAIPDVVYQYSQHDYTTMVWTREQLNDNLRGMIHELRFSAEHGFAELHRLTFERFNKDFFDRIWVQIDGRHNSSEEVKSTYELLYEAESALDVDLLNAAMNLNRDSYYLRPLHRSAFDGEKNPREVTVSVVLPAYNAENYLSECLDSLREQTFQDFEVIIVDDGSWDSTPFIAEDAEVEDSRLCLVTQRKHTNAANVRNVGLAHAIGKFVLFFEADATANPDLLEKVVGRAGYLDADVVMFGMEDYDVSLGEKRDNPLALRAWEMPAEQPFSAKQAANKIFNLGVPTVLNKLFKTDFVRRHNLLFQDISSCNDMFFSYAALSRAERIATCDEVLVCHKVGVQKSLAEDIEYHTSNYFYALQALRADLENRGLFTEFEQSYVNFAADYAISMRYVFPDTFSSLVQRQLIERDLQGLGLVGYDENYFYYPDRARELAELVNWPHEDTINFVSHENRGEDDSTLIAVSLLVSAREASLAELILTLNSLQYQRLENIEILIVKPRDEAATSEMERRAEHDSRIHIIDDFGSDGESLQHALESARGHFLCFVEVGDFMDVSELLFDGHRALELDVDALWADRLLIRHHSTGNILSEHRFATIDGSDMGEESMSSRSALCGSLIRREFVLDSAARMSRGSLRFVEGAFVAQLVTAGARCATTSNTMYHRANRGEGQRNLTFEQGQCILASWEGARAHARDTHTFVRLRYRALTDALEKMERARQPEFSLRVAGVIDQDVRERFLDSSGLSKEELAAARELVTNPEGYCVRQLDTRVRASVVMPVYNVQNYLPKSLDSLRNQSVRDIEIICVDDGSTDQSLAIIRDMADRDDRIFILTQQQHGAGAARNRGMDQARGKYLLFLDSDDYASPDLVEHAANRCDETNADLVAYHVHLIDYYTGKEELRKKVREEQLPSDKDVFCHDDLGAYIFTWCHGNAWDKIFRRSFVEASGLRFQEQRTTNDHYFVRGATLLASRMAVLDEALYYSVRNRPGSLQQSRGLSWHCFYDALRADRALMQEIGIYERYEQAFINFALATCMWNWRTLEEPAKSELAAKLRHEWFSDFGIADKPENYFDDSSNYADFLGIMRTEEETKTPVAISVIMPCYNAGAYIGETIESMLNQTFKDFEILCVDDASDDDTMDVCRRYAEQDSRVKVITENPPVNRGPGGARNIGLDIARGKYIYYMDSDDLLTDNCFERLYMVCEVNGLDLVYFEADSFYETPELERMHANYKEAYHRLNRYEGVFTGSNLFAQFRKRRGNDFKVSVCLQLVRRDFLESHGIRLPDLPMHVDEVYSIETLMSAKRVMVLPDRMYLRRVREGSVITRKSSQVRRMRAAVGVDTNLLRVMEKYEPGSLAYQAVVRRFDALAGRVEFLYDRMEPQMRREVIEELTAHERMVLQAALLRRKG